MKLYKFRSFENIEFTLDIIFNNRLYCTPHKELNDPFEGLFSTIEWKGGGPIRSPIQSPIQSPIRSPFGGSPTTVYKSLSEIPALEKEVRVCSLSSYFSDIRMWSHYAANHTGIAIEVELEDEPNLYKVDYSDGLQKLSEHATRFTSPSDVLSFKTSHWKYEREFRIITEKTFYPINGKISAIYFGIRSTDIHKEMIKRSTNNEIPLFETKIDEKTVQIRPSKRVIVSR